MKKKKIITVALCVLNSLFVLAALLIALFVRWGFATWGDLDIDEIIFQLQAPLDGTDSGIINGYLLKGLLPALLIFALYTGLLFWFRKKKVLKRYLLISFACTIVIWICTIAGIQKRLNLFSWINGQIHGSTFIEENYADPASVKIDFPEKKRNLIFIYLESMETTYADRDSGGAQDKNMIPELTGLALENECFSGSPDTINGGIVFPGTAYTVGAMFATMSGLPLKTNAGQNNLDTQDSFFPEFTLLGDILKDNGYQQTLMIGSAAKFGGRKLLYRDHGDYTIEDYNWAISNKLIPEDYKVWWGFEDEKLFSFARDELKRMAELDQPFNFTLLTVDTHFEDGYVCGLCGDEFGDNQYANVMACSSRQTAQFIEWIQQQDFYENTSIVVCGDHTTMDRDFLNDLDADYHRKTYTAFINADAENMNREARREFCSFDILPTTIAALGAGIDGERLGLGTNLFSGKETLTEEFGEEKEREELERKSEFMAQYDAGMEMTKDFARRIGIYIGHSFEYDEETQKLKVKVSTCFREIATDKVEVHYVDPKSKKETEVKLTKEVHETYDYYYGYVDTSGCDPNDLLFKTSIFVTDFNDPLVRYFSPGEAQWKRKDLAAYLTQMSSDEDHVIFLSIMDEGTKGLSAEEIDVLKTLTGGTDLSGRFRMSYLAVIDGKTVTEQKGYDCLTESGVLSDGETNYTIVSGGYDNGNTASIIIRDVEFALAERGLNIVVYDKKAGLVVDTQVFDTYSGIP